MIAPGEAGSITVPGQRWTAQAEAETTTFSMTCELHSPDCEVIIDPR